MKALKTKVILSAFVLLFAVVATIGSTFAWFTVSNEVKVDQFELNVQTSDSLLIRVYKPGETINTSDLRNANTYSTNLTSSMIGAAGTYSEGFTGWRLTPLTSVQFSDTELAYSGLNPFQLSVLSLSNPVVRTHTRVDNDAPALAANRNNASGSFIELKFWVMSQSVGTRNLYLHELVITSDTTLTDNLLPGQQYAANAVRLGVGATSGATTGEGDLTPTTGFVFANFLHTSATQPYGFAFIPGMRGYDNTALSTLNALDQSIDNIVESHALFTTTGGDVANESKQVAVGSPLQTYTDAGVQSITTLAANTPQLISVRIYIEGWDAYATNAIIAAKFKINFSFVIPSTSA